MNQVERLQALLDTVQRNRPRSTSGTERVPPPSTSDVAHMATAPEVSAPEIPAPEAMASSAPLSAPEPDIQAIETQPPPASARPRAETIPFSVPPSAPAGVPAPDPQLPDAGVQPAPVALAEPTGDAGSVSRFLSRVPAAQEASFGELVRRSLALRPQ